jgi:hypothetical protein
MSCKLTCPMEKLFNELAESLEKSIDQYLSYNGDDLGKRAMALKSSACIIRFFGSQLSS